MLGSVGRRACTIWPGNGCCWTLTPFLDSAAEKLLTVAAKVSFV